MRLLVAGAPPGCFHLPDFWQLVNCNVYISDMYAYSNLVMIIVCMAKPAKGCVEITMSRECP